MKHLTRKEIDAGDFEFGSYIKETEVEEVGGIRLWFAQKNWVVENTQVDETSYYICCEINEFCNVECLHTENLVEACKAFNIILETMKA